MSKRILVFLSVLLAMGACIGPQPAAAPPTGTAAPLSRAVGFVMQSTPEIPEQVILVWPSFTAVYVPQAAAPSATPTSTATPTPSSTPSPTATPTTTPELEKSPTPETTIAPAPTATPGATQPPDEGCYGTAQVSALTIRTGPATGETLKPSIGQYWQIINGVPDRMRIDQIVYVYVHEGRVDEWMHAYDSTRDGWSAALWDNLAYIRYENSDECAAVRFGTEQPVAGPAVMWFAVPGASGDEMLASYAALQGTGISYGVKSYAEILYCRQAIEAGGICIYKIPPDCPDLREPPEWSAVKFLENIENRALWAMRDLIPSGRFYVAPVNECDWADLAWWRAWMLAAIDYAEVNHWPPLALLDLGPGYGDFTMIRELAPALERLEATGGIWAMHAYTVNDTPDLCSSSVWLGYRHRLLHGYMAALGIDLRIVLTETAREWGGSPVDERDFVCFWAEVAEHDPYVAGIVMWLAGYHPSWPQANLESHMVPIAQQIAERWRTLVGW